MIPMKPLNLGEDLPPTQGDVDLPPDDDLLHDSEVVVDKRVF